MADIPSIAQVLGVAKIAQYIAANDTSSQLYRKGGTLNLDIAVQIYNERSAIQHAYDLNPNDSTLRASCNFLWAILDRFQAAALSIYNNTAGAAPTVTGPTDASVVTGATASFTIVVTSVLDYTITWYRNGVLIAGANSATYSFATVIGDNGATFSALVTNSVGSASSRIATLTVGAAVLTGYAAFMSFDPYPALLAGTDDITYQTTFNITDGQPLSVTMLAGAADDQFLVFRYPASQSTKTVWGNTALNSGLVPDSVFRDVLTLGSWKYIVSRNSMSIDVTQPMTFS